MTDPDGSELPDLEAARAEAIGAARHLWAAAILAGRDLPDWSFEIADGQDRLLATVSFGEALPQSLRRMDQEPG